MRAIRRSSIALLLCGCYVTTVWAATEVASIDRLLAMTPAELGTAQVKLSYLGPQDEPISTIVATVDGHAIDWAAFRPWLAANDDMYQHKSNPNEPSFAVQAEDVQALLRSLRPFFSRSSVSKDDAWVSFTFTVGQGASAVGIERTVDRAGAGEVFILLRNALRADPKDITLVEGRSNIQAMYTLQWWGCAQGLLPEAIPAKEVTGQVRVTTSGARWNERTRRFESTATVTNTSPQAIRGPIALVVDFTEAFIRVRNACGTTCVTTPVGREFINLPMPAEMLAPGQALETLLEFERDEQTPIQFTTKVLAGPGER